jgi:hypothetical protein
MTSSMEPINSESKYDSDSETELKDHELLQTEPLIPNESSISTEQLNSNIPFSVVEEDKLDEECKQNSESLPSSPIPTQSVPASLPVTPRFQHPRRSSFRPSTVRTSISHPINPTRSSFVSNTASLPFVVRKESNSSNSSNEEIEGINRGNAPYDHNRSSIHSNTLSSVAFSLEEDERDNMFVNFRTHPSQLRAALQRQNTNKHRTSQHLISPLSNSIESETEDEFSHNSSSHTSTTTSSPGKSTPDIFEQPHISNEKLTSSLFTNPPRFCEFDKNNCSIM